MDKLIGRHKEQSILKNCLESGRSEFVVIYGRRRIGKTFLVRRFFNDTYDFSFVGKHEMPREQQLADFAQQHVHLVADALLAKAAETVEILPYLTCRGAHHAGQFAGRNFISAFSL